MITAASSRPGPFRPDPPRPPLLVGIGGGVAAGKSTLAASLRDALIAHGVVATVLCTDCFLHPNAVLDAAGLSTRKGFPETFDTDAVAACLRSMRAGGPVDIPVYSHETYDIVAAERRLLDPADVVIVEGVNVFWPPIADELDIGIYLDADDNDLRQWFLDRFESFCAAASHDPRSFYRPLAGLPPAERRSLADAVWSAVNLVNIREHIAPSKSRATYIARKAADHSLLSLSDHG